MNIQPFNTTRSWWLYAASIAVLTTIFFASVTGHGIDNHDAETFYDNARISQDFSYFFSPDRQQITGRPAADLSKWLASLALGDSAAGFHLLVVAAHALAALLLARLVDVLYDNRLWAFASGLLFLVNVTHFQAVHHISALDYPLALCWGLAALLLFLRYEREEKHSDLVLTYLFFSLGALTHMAAAALGPLCLYWSWQRSGNLRAAVLRVAPLGVLLAALVLYGLAITPKATSTWAAIDHYEAAEVSPLSPLRVLAWFSGRLLSTAHWVPPLSVYKLQAWEMLFGSAVLLGLGGLAWYRPQRAAIWVAWVVLTLLPFLFIPEELVLEFLPEGPSRYLYLASAGSSVLIAWGLAELAARGARWRAGLALFTLVALLVSSYAGIKRVEGFSHYTSGRHNIAANRIEEGAHRLRLAIVEGRDTIPLQDAYLRRCMALLYLGRDPSSELGEALALYPNDYMLGAIAAVLGTEDPATSQRSVEWINSALRRSASSGLGGVFQAHISTIYLNLGKGYLRQNERAAARSALERALQMNPQSQEAQRLLKEMG
jgi:tetratricopeptide (TPR) repeat protein